MPAAVVRIEGQFDDTQFKKLQTTLNRLGVEIEGVEKKASASFAQIGKSLSDNGTKMADFGKSWSMHVTAPLAAIGAVGVKAAADLETTMATLQVNAQASGVEMERLTALAMKMGADTVFSAGEAGAAMLELSKGGLSTAAIEGGALAATLNLAATEGMSLSDAATIMVQNMNTFGIKAGEASRVTGVLAAGAVASTAGVQDLADAMKYVGSTASNLKIPIEDTVTALAAMNNAGIDSTTAGTSLNRFLLGLLGLTKKGAGVIKSFGLEFTDANGQLRPMTDIVAELQSKIGGLNDDMKAQVLKDLFGVEGMRAANVLLADGVKGYQNLRGEVTKAGVDAELAGARMSGTAGAMEAMKGSMETAAIVIGNALAPTVQSLAGFIARLANAFTALSPGVQQAIVTVGALVAAIGPLIFVAGKMVSGIGDAFTAFSKLPGMFSAVSTGAKALWGVLASNPFLAIAAVVAVVAVLIITHWDEVKAFLLGVWNTIKDAVQSIWQPIKEFFTRTLEVIRNAFTNTWNGISNFLTGAWNGIKSVASGIWNGIKDAVLGALDLLGKGIEGYVNIYKTVFTVAFNAIKAIATTVMDSVIGTVKGAVNFVIGGINRVIGALNSISVTIPDWVPEFGGKTFGFSLPYIPALAEGGIVTKPTLALVGEAGPEAVIPLRSSRAQGYGTGGVTIAPGAVQITIQGAADANTVTTIQRVVEDALYRLAKEVTYA